MLMMGTDGSNYQEEPLLCEAFRISGTPLRDLVSSLLADCMLEILLRYYHSRDCGRLQLSSAESLYIDSSIIENTL